MVSESKNSFTSINHYVPQWHQREFLDTDNKYFYLDLLPQRIYNNSHVHYRNSLRKLGSKKCFQQSNLYTLFDGEHQSDVIEKKLFGAIDDFGADSVRFFSSWDGKKPPHQHINKFLIYLDAQKLRTPRGLDYIKAIAKTNNHEIGLHLLNGLLQAHVTIWAECVWEIFSCNNSAVKLILSDNPVTIYNKKCFPNSKWCTYPNDSPISLLGSQTLYPLNENKLIVLTNLGYVRNPWVNLLNERVNPRVFSSALIDTRKILLGSELKEEEVLAINYIFKSRAHRYIASSNEEYLYPERYLKSRMWDKLGHRMFLMPDPRKISFTVDTIVGNKDGTAWGLDEYGRKYTPNKSDIEKHRKKEFESFEKHKKIWDQQFGPLSLEEIRRYF